MSLASVIERAEELSREPARLPGGTKLALVEAEYTAEEVRHAEILCEMRSLSGGGHFDAVVQAMWMWIQQKRQRARRYKATPAARLITKECDARRHVKLRSVTVGTGTCKYCGEEFAITAYRLRHKKLNSCVRSCPKKPNNNVGKLYSMAGKTMPLSQWAAESGLPVLRVRRRLKKGLSLEQALTQERFSTRGVRP
jgi:hypothetical protein